MYDNILVPISLDADRDAEKALKVARIHCGEGGKITGCILSSLFMHTRATHFQKTILRLPKRLISPT